MLLRRPGILDVPTCAGTRRATDDANVSTRPVPIGTSAHFSLFFLRKKRFGSFLSTRFYHQALSNAMVVVNWYGDPHIIIRQKSSDYRHMIAE